MGFGFVSEKSTRVLIAFNLIQRLLSHTFLVQLSFKVFVSMDVQLYRVRLLQAFPIQLFLCSYRVRLSVI